MILRISKKKIKTISIITVAVVIPIVIFALYLYNERNIRFDKYGEVTSDCVLEKRSGEAILKCKTLLEVIERKKNNEVCLNLMVISLGNQPRPLVVCADETEILGLENPDIYSEQKVPINLEIRYKRGIFQIAKFEKASVSLMPDSELFSILSDLYKRGLTITDIRSQADIKLGEIKFFTHKLDIAGMEDFWFIMFRDVFIKEASLRDGNMYFNLEIFVEDYKFNSDVVSGGLIYSGLETDETLLFKEDISKVQIDKKYHAGFLFLPKDTVIKPNQKEEICATYDKEVYLLNLFCNSDRTMESLLLKEDIEKYIKELGEIETSNIENLMFVALESYE